MMFLPLRMVPFLKILKTVFLYSFWGVAARKHKNLVCTDLIRHFGTSFEPVLSWGKKSLRGLRIFPLKHSETEHGDQRREKGEGDQKTNHHGY